MSHGANDHERTDVQIAPIRAFGIGLAIMTATAMLLMIALFRYLATHQPSEEPVTEVAVPAQAQLPPQPRLQVTPSTDLQALRESEEKTLTTYDWVDRKQGVVRIPIDQAMDLLVQRGKP